MHHRRHQPEGKRKRGIPLWLLIIAAFLALQVALFYPAFRHFTSFQPVVTRHQPALPLQRTRRISKCRTN
jgi:hypothetical protein